MKKIFLTLILILILISSIFILTGCDNNSSSASKNPLVGSWDHSGYVYTFNDDKTGSYSVSGTEMKFTYEDDGSKVSILYTGNTNANTFEYKIDGKKLIIKDSFGKDVEYIKK